MFERFTEQAIKVILLAQEESRRLGHNFVGTEQILLGLSGEGTGVAAKVLKSMGINLKDVRSEVEKIIGRGSEFVAVEIPFTARAKRVLQLSLEEARQLGHNYIGTEHLLLGVIREGEGVGVRVLENLGADLAKVCTEVILMLGETVEITAVSESARTKMPRWEEIWADLAQMAADGKIDPEVVQQKKIKPVIEILGSTKSNPQKSSLSKKRPISNPLWRMLKGQVINEKYFLQELLGEGGYGAVYLADEVLIKRDKQLEQVAIKLILSDDTTESQLDELIVTRKLLHPNLTGCFDRGECNLLGADYLYLLMELADFSLEKQLTQEILSQAETILLVKDIAEALVYLHNQVVVLPNQPEPVTLAHRDLKPGNILRIGNKWKLSDFGLVKIIGSGSVLNTSNLFGTPLYLPPESYEGKISPAWDVWALGIVIVEALTGKLPFNGETLQQLQKQVCDGEPDLSGLPQKFEPIVRGCLEKDRHKRWTAKQVLEQLPVQKWGYVLLYNAGLEYEGIYTIQRGNRNQVIIFEDQTDAARFSSYLEGQGFTNISVEFFEKEDINDFCNCLNFNVEWIATGEEVIFNEKNVCKTQQVYALPGKTKQPEEAVAYNNRGKVYYDLKENQKALDEYNQALKLDPNYVDAYIGRGNVYAILVGKRHKALDDYKQALKLDPNLAHAYLGRGSIYFILGEKQKALEDYNQALKLDPNYVATYLARGHVYGILGEKQKALEDYKQALKLDPNCAIAYVGRGNVYYKLGEKQKALEDYKQALKLDPNCAIAYVGRGRFYYELGKKQKALEDYQKAAQLFQEEGNTDSYKIMINEIIFCSQKTGWNWFRSNVESLWDDLSSML